MTETTVSPNKSLVLNPIYWLFPLLCPLCLKLQKISHVYKKPYLLLYHMTTEHSKEDEINTGISIFEIKLTIGGIATAHQLKMFFDFPKHNNNFQSRI